MNNIYLCGFMGCKKTTLGQRLAAILGRRFLDLDTFLQKKCKSTMPELFVTYGEAEFRKIENAVFEEVCLMENAVVSVGDGTFWLEQNIIAAKNSGTIVYLLLPFSTCYKRIRSDKRHHITRLPESELEDTFHKQHTIYKISANLIYEPDNSSEKCARKLAKLLKNRK